MKIVVVDANLPLVRGHVEAAIAAASPGSTVAWHPRYDADAVARDLVGAEVLVASRYTASLVPHCGALRLLQCPAAGLDAIDLAALPDGVQVARTGHHERSIAEHVLAGVVMVRRDLRAHDEALRLRGEWTGPTYDPSRPLPPGLDGALVGLVGFGAIGQAVWTAFRALGARGAAVTGSGRVDAAAHGLAWAGRADGGPGGPGGLDRLVAESDVLVLSAPLTPQTRGMLDARVLGLARPGAVVVNVGRGPLVEEDALFDALAAGRLGGAVLDVWWSYPRGGSPGGSGTGTGAGAGAVTGAPGRRPWGELPTVVASPHSSGVTRQTFLARTRDIAENVRRLEAGEPLLHPVPR